LRYDDALPQFVSLVADSLGLNALLIHAFLRDADGVLTLVLREDIDAAVRSKLESSIREKLGAYAAEYPLATPSDLFDPRLAEPDRDQWELIQQDGRERFFVRLIERRLVGQDWVRGIQPAIPHVPPVVAFASHKGGVGRSTALSVASVEFASRGKSILAIDLDLEAPGLGGMFLPNPPAFGALDYYVENSRGHLDDTFLDEMVALSPLTTGSGRVMIVPAVGQRCHDFPQNVIGKLSRAYLDDVTVTPLGSQSLTFLDQTRDMISDLCRRQHYDAVFLDARAGLNETTATTIQGLGADVLFFGVDTPQTWEGYRFFLAHLARFKPREGEEDWRYRLKMVHAKASADTKSWARFRDKAFELFAEHLYDEIDEQDRAVESPFGFDIDDNAAPHYAWPILVDPAYYAFDPVERREQLTASSYTTTFGRFLQNLADRLEF
jgi:MinD-like ATPase involved in chromosome partitioning or flagellar assembly